MTKQNNNNVTCHVTLPCEREQTTLTHLWVEGHVQILSPSPPPPQGGELWAKLHQNHFQAILRNFENFNHIEFLCRRGGGSHIAKLRWTRTRLWFVVSQKMKKFSGHFKHISFFGCWVPSPSQLNMSTHTQTHAQTDGDYIKRHLTVNPISVAADNKSQSRSCPARGGGYEKLMPFWWTRVQ